jgi:hypothetical protein
MSMINVRGLKREGGLRCLPGRVSEGEEGEGLVVFVLRG